MAARSAFPQHRDILGQIEKGTISGANSAVRYHLREVLGDLPQIVAANAPYFELPDGALPHPVNAPIQGGEQG